MPFAEPVLSSRVLGLNIIDARAPCECAPPVGKEKEEDEEKGGGDIEAERKSRRNGGTE